MKKIINRILSIILVVLIICYNSANVDVAATDVDQISTVPDGYIGIYTKDDLSEVRTNPSGKYILMNDIVFDESDFITSGKFYNSGEGWEPIGTSDTPFTGVFNGNYFTIKKLYINTTSNYAGLFGYCSDPTIENLIIEEATIFGGNSTGGVVAYIEHGSVLRCSFNGTIKGEKCVGGIVGQAYSTKGAVISYCESYGSISGASFVGGILGCHNTYSKAVETGRYRINYCINAASVYGNNSIGGIAGRIVLSRGYNSSGSYYIGVTSTINQCINTGEIICTGNYVGGVIGEVYTETYVASEQRIDNCYNTGNVSGSEYVGGLVGFFTYDNVYQIKLVANNSYAAGNVSANSNFGGCFGKTPNSTSYCYYFDEAVTNATCLAGTPKSSDQLAKQGTFEQWDFDSVWTIDGREDYEYPELCNVALVFPGEYPYHEHSYITSVTTPATHLKEGVMTYTCSCGDSYTEAISKLTDHTYNGVVTVPTCTAQGYTTYTCACGESYVSNFVSANGHSYTGKVTTPATHLKEGVMTYTCTCGDSYTEAITKTPEHTYEAKVTAPTCTEQGYTTYICECNDTYVADYVDATGHSHDAAITTPATHLKEGVMTYTCACGDTYTEAIVKTAEHIYDAVVTAPTCEDKGYTTYACACGDSYVADYVQENGHSYSSEITIPATHLTEGIETYTCACGDSYTEVIEKTAEHTYKTVVVAPTCIEKGFTVHTCACGDSYKDNYTAVTDHKDADGDEYCDCCEKFLDSEEESNNCSHICHKDGFIGFIWKIINFFCRLFGINPVCECGKAHY